MDKIDYLMYEFNKGREYSERGKHMRNALFCVMICILVLYLFIFIYPEFLFFYIIMMLVLTIGLYLLCFEIEGKIGTRSNIEKVNKSRRSQFISEQKRLIECLSEQGLQAQSVYNILKERQKRVENKKEGNFIKVVVPIILTLISVLLKPLENVGGEMWAQYIIMAISLLFLFSSLGWVLMETFGKLNEPIKIWYWKKYEGERILAYLQDLIYL